MDHDSLPASPPPRPSRLRLTRRQFLLGGGGLLVAGAAGGLGAYRWRQWWKSLTPWQPPAIRYDPPPITDEVRFGVLGDWGSGTRAQSQVLAAADRAADDLGGLHAGLLLGDNFYFHGVSGTDDPLWREYFEQPFDTPWLGKLTWHAVLGNHDYYGQEQGKGNARAQIEYSALSRGRWSMPADYWRQDFHARDGRTIASVVALNTNHEWYEVGNNRAVQLAWLEEQLAGLAAAPHAVIVIGHHPVKSYSHSDPEAYMVDGVQPLLRRYPPHLYLCGHNHCMEMIEDGALAYAVVGCSGRKLYDVRAGEGTVFHRKTFGFGVLRAGRSQVVLEFRDRDNRLLHTWRRAIGDRARRA